MRGLEEAVGELGKEPQQTRPQDPAWLRYGMRKPREQAQLPRRVWIWGDQQPQELRPVIPCNCSAVAPGAYQGNAAQVGL